MNEVATKMDGLRKLHGVGRTLGVLVLALCAGGCGDDPAAAPAPVAVSTDVRYVLDKFSDGSREERSDALRMIIADRSLYGAAERLLRQRVFQENDLFLREQIIDGLAVMAVDRLYGPDQVKQFGTPREARPVGYPVPPEPPPRDPTVEVLARLVHDDSEYVVVHARAARARLGVQEGFWGLVSALDEREKAPELADLSLVLLRQLTGLHMSATPEEWWVLCHQYRPGYRYVDKGFQARVDAEKGL